MGHNLARPLVSKDWGYNWLELIPPEFRTALKYKITRTPGVPNDTDPDEPVGLVITSKVTTDRINEKEKETVELDTALNLPVVTKNHEITKDYGGAEVDVVMIISDNPSDIGVGEGVQWTESYTKTLSTDLGIAFSVGKRLTNAFVDAVVIISGGSGYPNGTHTGTLTGGGGTAAAFTYVVSGGTIISTTVTNEGSGYTDRPVVSVGGGNAVLTAILGGWPNLVEKDFDEEMKVDKIITKRVVDPLYPVDPALAPDGYVYEIKPIDKWHSWLEVTHRVPLAVDAASAHITYAFRPYKFPGTLEPFIAQRSNAWLGYRAPKADLVEITIRTWWQTSASAPIIAVDDIIPDTIVVVGADRIERYSDVLHDGYVTTILTASQVYLATTPTFTQYYLGTPSGTSTPHSLITPFSLGSGGYSVGDHLTFAGGSAEIEVTALQSSGVIGAWTVIDEGVGGTYFNPVTAIGGTGSGAQFNIFLYETADYTPGTAWVGTERIISATVTEEKEKNLWKVQTESVIMR